MPLSEVINRPCALSDDCVCSSTFPFVQSHNLLDLICCTYKDGDGSQVTMDSAVDCSYQGMYIAYFVPWTLPSFVSLQVQVWLLMYLNSCNVPICLYAGTFFSSLFRGKIGKPLQTFSTFLCPSGLYMLNSCKLSQVKLDRITYQ